MANQIIKSNQKINRDIKMFLLILDMQIQLVQNPFKKHRLKYYLKTIENSFCELKTGEENINCIKRQLYDEMAIPLMVQQQLQKWELDWIHCVIKILKIIEQNA